MENGLSRVWDRHPADLCYNGAKACSFFPEQEGGRRYGQELSPV